MKNLIRGRSRLPWQNVNFYENIKFNREKKEANEGEWKEMKDSTAIKCALAS
jgi:hypothetical protein